LKNVDRYVIDAENEGKALRTFLRGVLNFSHRSIVALKKNTGVTINGVTSHMNMLLKENDVVEIHITDSESEGILPEQMMLDIIFEDDYLVVVNKPANMPVHPTRKHIMGTLANGLAYYWLNTDKAIKIRPVNRLDKDTSGLVVFAKSAHIQHLLSFDVGTERFKKEYIAVVHGRLEKVAGTIDLPIAREEEKAMKRVVREDGDRAVTHYKVVSVADNFSLVNILLETGRTHQIRVHMSYIGHPLLGDSLYGGKQDIIDRQALHAEKITMQHPITKQWHYFVAPLPEDIKKVIEGSSVYFIKYSSE
jgi:23S rRNA pseudouridine1911/1915/1917 synthase